jgi:hypothetical protein
MRPGTTLYWVMFSGLYWAWIETLKGGAGAAEAGEGAAEIAVQDGLGQGVHGGDGRADGGGVGRVRLDEDGGGLAAEEVAGEIFGDVDDELDLAELQEALGLGFGGGFADDLEVVGVPERPDEGAGERALVGGAQGGRQVPGVGIDGETEEDELEQRNADHHQEGHAVALHLDEFLEDDGPEAVEAEAGHRQA